METTKKTSPRTAYVLVTMTTDGLGNTTEICGPGIVFGSEEERDKALYRLSRYEDVVEVAEALFEAASSATAFHPDNGRHDPHHCPACKAASEWIELRRSSGRAKRARRTVQ